MTPGMCFFFPQVLVTVDISFHCLAALQGVVKPSTIAACIATALAPLYNWSVAWLMCMDKA